MHATHRRARLTSTLAVSIVAVLTTGCGQAVTPDTSASAATASLAATPAPSPSDVSTAPRELTAGSAPLAAGLYTRATFRPRLTFEVDEGWLVVTLTDAFFDVQQQQGTPDVIAVQFANVDGIIGAGGALIEATSAEAAAQTINENAGLVVIGEGESRLGGLTGFTVEVENTGAARAAMLNVPAGRLGIDPGRRLWVSLFDTDDGLLAVTVGGSVADWQHALTVAEPVLESIVIGEPAQ